MGTAFHRIKKSHEWRITCSVSVKLNSVLSWDISWHFVRGERIISSRMHWEKYIELRGFILNKRQGSYLNADADANADAEMQMPSFPNGRTSSTKLVMLLHSFNLH